MSKIVAAANSMVANQKKINPVLTGQNGNEIFFVYDGKFKWSMNHSNDQYWLYFYPGRESIEELAGTYDWDQVNMVAYSAKEIGTKEAFDTFSELYTTIKEKLYGVDEALDEIIGDLF